MFGTDRPTLKLRFFFVSYSNLTDVKKGAVKKDTDLKNGDRDGKDENCGPEMNFHDGFSVEEISNEPDERDSDLKFYK